MERSIDDAVLAASRGAKSENSILMHGASLYASSTTPATTSSDPEFPIKFLKGVGLSVWQNSADGSSPGPSNWQAREVRVQPTASCELGISDSCGSR